MRNLKLSILVIAITMLTVVAMSVDMDNLFSAKNNNKISEVTQTIPPEASGEENSLNKEESAQQGNDKLSETQEQEEPLNVQEQGEQENQEVLDPNENSNEKPQGYDNIYPEKRPSRSDDNNQKTAEVFKIDKGTISDQLSFEEKRKLLSIAGKLSMIDYANIVDIMQSSEEMKSAAQIFGILRLRLDAEDYQQIVEILDPYLYIDNIEGNISS